MVNRLIDRPLDVTRGDEDLILADLYVKFKAKQLGLTGLRVPDFWESQSHSSIQTQQGMQPFVPFPWQQQWVDGVTRREMILKSRDVGSSEICVRYYCWLMLREGGNILIKADRHENAKNLIKMARQYLTSLPTGERPTLLKDNETELELQGIGTIKAMAQGGGRSERCRYLLMTERAFWEHPAEELAAISGALVAGGYEAIESTAEGFNEYHALWQDPDNGYRKTFVPWTANPTHDETWRQDKKRMYATAPHLLAQEAPSTPEEAFIASGNCVFDVEAIQRARELCREPLEVSQNGALKIWSRPVVGRRYVAGVDVAEGIDVGHGRLDYSGMAVYDWQTCRHVADLHGRWPLDVFAQLCVDLGRVYNNAFMGVERNNHGHAVLLVLKQLAYPAIYHHVETMEALTRRGGEHRQISKAGWPTTAKTKPILEKELAALIKSGDLASYDQAFWDECLSYVWWGNTQTGAQSGCHDDRVVKHMIALQMRAHLPAANSHVGGRWTMA